MEQVYIGLGSNQGDRLTILLKSIKGIQSFLTYFDFSSIWETKPMIVEDQPSFLNMVVTGYYSGSPKNLIHQLWQLEKAAGRNRAKEQNKGPRTLDLDILLFGQQIIHTEILTIPHPGITERAFVLVPLTEIDKSIVNPVNDTSYFNYLKSIEDQGYICYKKRDEIVQQLQQKE